MDNRYRGLIPFKPGGEWKGNRNGRPKGSISLTTLIKQVLAGQTLGGETTPDGRPVAEWFVDHMIIQAMKGNGSYMKEIIERNDGKIPDKFEVESTRSTKILKVPASKRRRKVADDPGDADP